MSEDWKDHRMEDLELHVRTRLESKHWMAFVAYDLTLYDDGNGEPMKFRNVVHGAEPTLDIKKAREFCNGHIKWDGCIGYDLRETHACGREALNRISLMFDRLYDIALERMPGNEEWLAKEVRS